MTWKRSLTCVRDNKKTAVIPTERSDEGPPSGYSYLLRSGLVEILHCVQDDSENVQDDSENVQDDS
mgnify:CR=1 FL=1